MQLFSLDPLYLAYITVLALSITVSIALIGYIWSRRFMQGGWIAIAFLGCVVLCCTGYLIEYMSPTLAGKLFSFNISYIGIVAIPVVLLLFSAQYAGRNRLINKRNIILLSIIPFITLILQWTAASHTSIISAILQWANKADIPYIASILPSPAGMHSLLYTNISLFIEGPFLVIIPQYNTWLWIFMIFNMLLMLISFVFLLQRIFTPPSLTFNQSVNILVIIFTPILANLIYLFHLSPMPHVDWTPAAFFISSIGITVAISRQGLLNIIPIGRDTAIELMNEGFLVLDPYRHVVDYNQSALNITGLSKEQIMHHRLSNLLETKLGITERYTTEQPSTVEIELDNDEHVRYYSVNRSPLNIKGFNSNGLVLIFHDITERKKAEAAMLHAAYHDPLTGLANRDLFNDRASIAIEEASRHNRKMAIMIIDIDKFKDINDTMGHNIGDYLLKSISDRMLSAVRKVDTVSRLGGDEFIVLLPEISEPAMVEKIAKRIMTSVSRPFNIENFDFNVTISIGISVFPEDAEKLEVLIKHADEAMYEVKRTGRNRFMCYANTIPNPPQS